MATATISNFSDRFPCHSVYTTTAVSMGDNKLGWTFGYDKAGYQNHYGQGIPITIPADASANVTSITVSVTFHSYTGITYAAHNYNICVLSTRYDTAQTKAAQYSNISGTTHATFTASQTTASETKNVTISGLNLAPGQTYYVYIHIGTYTTYARLHVLTNCTVTCTYEEGGKVRIYTSSGWVSATPYVYTSSGWVKAIPYVYTSSGWTKAT